MSDQAGIDRGPILAEEQVEDRSADDALRPRNLDEMIGQDRFHLMIHLVEVKIK